MVRVNKLIKSIREAGRIRRGEIEPSRIFKYKVKKVGEEEMRTISIQDFVIKDIEELKKITWDYSSDNILGLYEGKLVYQFLFECLDFRNPLMIRACNKSEGWVEVMEYEKEPDMNGTLSEKIGIPKRNKDGKVLTRKESYNGKIVILNLQGKEIITI